MKDINRLVEINANERRFHIGSDVHLLFYSA